jgi:hypothetical protein
MNGIHEVTGSIPVWSTTLRSPEPERATGGEPPFALIAGEVPATYPHAQHRQAKGAHRSGAAA